ncbi:helix-turn-helix domain-containing protein [Desulfovibrio sp.]|uniref:winged helix-turn-helix transcriptional regulator n=1 Tax=Desulfovibrio sp. TaxID=885 RepID=UPI0023C56A53|nr:helix-turn-helix domain-containing protein [Desulfovibrio sp.]MDE7240572.1 helix-turn-helix transcriptional regulator [Desulfovibrio sp.]
MSNLHDLPSCPVGVTVRVIGSKWKLLILQQLSAGPMRFTELQAALDGISKKVLSTTLRSLDEDGIVIRAVHTGSPISVEYTLSDIGRSLQPVLDAMGAWGVRYRKWREHALPDAAKNKRGDAQ